MDLITSEDGTGIHGGVGGRTELQEPYRPVRQPRSGDRRGGQVGSLCFAAKRLAFSRLPQVAMTHQRRRPVGSRNNHPQPAPAHAWTPRRAGDVRSSPADHAAAASGADRSAAGVISQRIVSSARCRWRVWAAAATWSATAGQAGAQAGSRSTAYRFARNAFARSSTEAAAPGVAASALAKHWDLVGAKDADESAPHHQVLVVRKVLDGDLPIPSRPRVAEVKRRMSAYAGRQPESLYDLIVCWHARRPIARLQQLQRPLDE